MEEKIDIEYYETDSGTCPYLEWEASLSKELRAYVRKRLNRVRLAHFGDMDGIEGESQLYELRIHLGPGYRIYFGLKENKVVILLCGGHKGHQKRDIARAKKYWKDCP